MHNVAFPEFTGVRCLMMPYIQGEPDSLPDTYAAYYGIVSSTFIHKGAIGFLTIDESLAIAGKPHRGQRARYSRALHTEAGLSQGIAQWGDVPTWGGRANVVLDKDVRILLASNVDDTCAVWNTEHKNTSSDGDIGHLANEYPYTNSSLLKRGEVHNIGIFTPHESLPVKHSIQRQFLRIVSSGVHGREPYFTINPLMA